jgi:predicted transcriptional regulator
MSRTTYNFHLPLSPEIHEMLREEAESSGQPATTLARQALRDWLVQKKRQRLHEEIAAFAEAHAGTELDLDEDLERAGIEALRNEDRQ